MRIHVLQHAANEGPGEIAHWAAERGHTVQIHHLYLDDPLPETGHFDFLVIMGGEMNIYQDRDYPWLKGERELVARALRGGKRAVGICLGAQFLADALGERVTQNAVYEIGWFPIHYTTAAREIFPKLPESGLALHWHGDTFSLPQNAIRLGASEACAEQGFVLPGKCLALQFHFETDMGLVREMVEGSSDFSQWPKGPFVQPPEKILSGAQLHCAQTRPLLFHLLDVFCAS
jgi:GMP synthase-like glutamine amidotransferase